MNVLITGHSGFIGSQTAAHFVEMGHDVYGVSRSLLPNCLHRQYVLDISDATALAQLAGEKCIDVIVHIAGKPIVSDCDKDPFNAYKINGLGAASVIEAARYAGVKRTVVIETDKVYGVQDEVPTTESATLNPGCPYEMSKVLAATFCDFYRKHYGMDIISVRPVNVFGPGDKTMTRIMPAALRNVYNGEGIPVHEHATKMYRDFIYVKDVVRMVYILATQKTKHSVYNLSANEAISILEFAQQVTDILEHDVAPIIVPSPGKYPETQYQSIDGSRFNKEFNFKFTSFRDATLETYGDYCK